MSGLTPTAAAMRAAGNFADQDLDVPLYAEIIDRECGLPELIAALECYVANDARSPMKLKAEQALRIAREGRQ